MGIRRKEDRMRKKEDRMRKTEVPMMRKKVAITKKQAGKGKKCALFGDLMQHSGYPMLPVSHIMSNITNAKMAPIRSWAKKAFSRLFSFIHWLLLWAHKSQTCGSGEQ